MAIRTDRHGRHTVEFQLRGLRVHRRCPPGTTKAEAGELETRLRREIFATRDLGREPTIDLPTAVATCLAETARGTTADKPRMHHAHALVDYLIGKTVHDIPTVAEAYRADAIEAGLALATVNARLNVLKKVAKWSWRVKGWTRENLSARIGLEDPKNERQRYESMANVRELIRGMQTAEGRAWVALAAGTGMRAGELHRLQRSDVRDGALVVRPAPGRKGTGRVVPVADWALPYPRGTRSGTTWWGLGGIGGSADDPRGRRYGRSGSHGRRRDDRGHRRRARRLGGRLQGRARARQGLVTERGQPDARVGVPPEEILLLEEIAAHAAAGREQERAAAADRLACLIMRRTIGS